MDDDLEPVQATHEPYMPCLLRYLPTCFIAGKLLLKTAMDPSNGGKAGVRTLPLFGGPTQLLLLQLSSISWHLVSQILQ